MSRIMQDDFVTALLDPASPPPSGLRCWHGGDPAARFDVHRNNVVHSLWQGLAVTFPALRGHLGEEDFQALATAYLRGQPPRDPHLAGYGRGFAGFLAGHEASIARPWLRDLAMLEWLRVDAYHAADADPVPAEAFAALMAQPERLAATCLRLHPAARWLDSAHPIVSLWRLGRDGDLPMADASMPEPALVFRPDEDVRVVSLPLGATCFLDALAAGDPLMVAADRALIRCPGFELTATLSLLIRHGLVVALD